MDKVSLIDNIESFLQSEKGYKKSWFRSFFGIFFVVVISIVVLVLAGIFGPGTTSTAEIATNLALSPNSSYLSAAQLLMYISYGFIGFPFVILFSLWIIGINQTSKSKYFHLFMWIMIFVAIILVLVALILFIRASITNYNSYLS